jgi:hypothetical protein
MNKYIKFRETVIDMADLIEFHKDVLYEIIFEFQNNYIVEDKNGIKHEISKAWQGYKYDVIKE